jgi:Activator of Hsp90 ATPase homolog 1-like protein
MIEPIEMVFAVACSAEHAFLTWTERFPMWWPKGHNASGDEHTVVVFEPRVGGRIFERTSDGREIDWGVVTRFDAPEWLGYRWHIRRGPDEATDVLLRFVATGANTCRVELAHSGWDALGDIGADWRDANRGGWSGLMPHFLAACESDSTG